MGTHHCGEFPKQQREKTLRFLMEQARSGSRKLLILDAANSCCSYDDLCASVCIGSHHAYVLACPPEQQGLVLYDLNRSLVSAMNCGLIIWRPFPRISVCPERTQRITSPAACAFSDRPGWLRRDIRPAGRRLFRYMRPANPSLVQQGVQSSFRESADPAARGVRPGRFNHDHGLCPSRSGKQRSVQGNCPQRSHIL
jgi:hypothetical protein